MSEQRLTEETETEIKWRAQFANVPDDIRALLAEVEALRQERDDARMYLAHIAGLIQKQLDNAEMDDLARIHLTIAATQARLAAEGGRP